MYIKVNIKNGNFKQEGYEALNGSSSKQAKCQTHHLNNPSLKLPEYERYWV